MKLFKTIILITFLTIANFSCVQDDDYSIPESLGIEENQDLSQLLDQINNGDVDLMTISQVKSFFIDGEVTLIESNIAVKGYVVSSDMTGNFYKEFYMQDKYANPISGIKVVINQVDSYNQFNFGREVYVRLQGLYIGETNSGDGVIAIGHASPGSDEIDEIPESSVPSTVIRSANTFDVVPLELNLGDINDSHIGIYTSAINSQFASGLEGLPYVEPTEQYDTQRDLESCVDSGSLKLETSAFSNFNDRILPTEGSGSIVGIITRDYFGDNRVMVLNSADDVSFDVARCDPLFSDDFSSNTLNNWYVKSVVGPQEWEITPYGNPAPSAKISGFSGGSVTNEDWLISKAVNLDGLSSATLTFQSVVRYSGPELTVYIGTDYNEGNPNDDGNWDLISATLDTDDTSWSSWTDSGNIDLSSYVGQTIYIAFKYVSNSSSATYEIDNVLVAGE